MRVYVSSLTDLLKELRVDGGNRLVRVFLFDEHGNFNLARRDHLNVHVCLKQRLDLTDEIERTKRNRAMCFIEPPSLKTRRKIIS